MSHPIAPDTVMGADSLWPVYLDAAERVAVLLPDPSRSAFDELVAITRQCFEADGIDPREAAGYVADLRGFGETVPETLNAQEAAGAEQGVVGRPDTPDGGGVIYNPPGVISFAIVAEVREALRPGPLSFRGLREKVGRGWQPARAALQALVDSGEVSREGERGRLVCFRLVAAADALAPAAPSGFAPLSHLAGRFDAGLVESWDEGPPVVFTGLEAATHEIPDP